MIYMYPRVFLASMMTLFLPQVCVFPVFVETPWHVWQVGHGWVWPAGPGPTGASPGPAIEGRGFSPRGQLWRGNGWVPASLQVLCDGFQDAVASGGLGEGDEGAADGRQDGLVDQVWVVVCREEGQENTNE